MRILFVSQYFFPEQFSNNAITRELTARGNDVEVVTGVPNYPAGKFFPGYSNRTRREEVWENIPIHRARSVARGSSKIQLIANFLTFPITGSWTALRRVRRPMDVVFVSCVSPLFQAIPAIVFRRVRRVPIVLWLQDIWPESAVLTLGVRHPAIVQPLTWLSAWIYRRFDLMLVQSEAFPAMIARHGVASERIRVLPNTAPSFYRPLKSADAPDEGALVPDYGFRLMFAGNIGESQDFETLIAAADQLRDRRALQWVIIGSGRALDGVKAEVSRRGLDDAFHFLGRFQEERMPRFFAHADALLVSLKDLPIFALTVPYKVQTYMACGKPILASLAGEGARIVSDADAGVVVPPSAPGRLAAAIVAMMDTSDDQRAQWGENARAYFDAHYRPERVYADLEGWLEEAIRGVRQ